ncbi:hypothetical protein SAMN06265373_102307 [Shimia sagamensis]|uniref:Uncharacterized protein n=1 Tax=Shimia sagamensis TaxID=1566352 RepID=A0ABY1NKD7_9RHOB|nr:hypothetical protein SAMN06265373_102307 [Shimia sagamensis]
MSASGWLLPSDNQCWARSRCKHVAAAPQGGSEPKATDAAECTNVRDAALACVLSFVRFLPSVLL